MDKTTIQHIVLSIVIATICSAIEANTGCSYFAAFLAGVMPAVVANLVKNWTDTVYQRIDTMQMFDSDVFFGSIGGIVGGLLGACVTYLI